MDESKNRRKFATKTRGPVSKYTPKPLDQTLFTELYDILRVECFDSNLRATARALDIAPLTARRWMTEPPKNRWINFTLRECILDIVLWMENSKHKKHRKTAQRVKTLLSQIHAGQKLHDMIEWNTSAQSGAVRHLLLTLNKAPGQTLSTKQLRLPRYSGGYSMNSLRKAAKILELNIHTEGFGEEKVTYYEIPESDD